ncbi:glycerol-3-phosphate 1-O-acyltransferase PlsY [Helicobacter saguini]|uniref:Glycerol-3-phosphate acyltransferase n=1 Tax=Helicobacter saguini TaxID=1548018 RepID=A0A347VU17_9HELI|nr:glycerol-3-phosphate 1-O-acyltransferase PlsY [Helicobacter saguini]MWV68249.1 glycerol-3-phosphate 1-O-acyltransferase PlsY [Helicobacter saguini]MWV70287.1 glycerol-3-phosphate 1-O-acyltransferase PlsY [Helicobacter saguini]MWV72189.1 glycerol-3-phosphate 1-O-acyltransferase PlsY [Helicobacter saguini]TLD95352.1 glycerol-3-phosphate 1-O-acyltransferase PlsY [Helicobacter saguini]
MLTNPNVLFYIIAYFVGAIPFGAIIVKVFAKKNVLEIGSKSTGATNVYRAFADISPKKARFFSISTLILDACKGMFVVLAAKCVGLSYETQYTIAILAILGHCYSPFLRFNGGKGVATAIGSVILLIPIEGTCGLLVWAIVGKVFKVSSLSSLLGVLSGILLTFIVPNVFALPPSIDVNVQIHTHTPLVLIGLIILNTHTENIKRLIKREEKSYKDNNVVTNAIKI